MKPEDDFFEEMKEFRLGVSLNNPHRIFYLRYRQNNDTVQLRDSIINWAIWPYARSSYSWTPFVKLSSDGTTLS